MCVTVLDFTDDFIAMRKDGVESCLKTDTHWTPAAMRLAAKKTAEAIGNKYRSDYSFSKFKSALGSQRVPRLFVFKSNVQEN